MPIYFQKMIYRSDLQSNRDALFVFGDNHRRVGLGGQAKEMRGESNAIGIRTKWSPTNDHDSFFYDKDYYECARMILDDFRPVVKGIKERKLIIIPADGLGTGLSRLPETSPRLDAYLKDYINNLKLEAERYDHSGRRESVF